MAVTVNLQAFDDIHYPVKLKRHLSEKPQYDLKDFYRQIVLFFGDVVIVLE